MNRRSGNSKLVNSGRVKSGVANSGLVNSKDVRHGRLAVTAAAVSAVIYGPMLWPGYPLRYDLVSVPRPVLGEDALGLGDRLPRAIPLDAAVALLARLMPDDLVTQLLGLLALTLAGWGAAVLTPAPMPGRLLALLVAVWNPFVLEQLAIGHLPHLLGYGALPWVAIFGRALVRSGSGPDATAGRRRQNGIRAWGGLAAVAGFGSLTPGGGVLVVIAGTAGVLAGWTGRHPRGAGEDTANTADTGRARRALIGLATLGLLQLPWLVAAAAAPAFATPAGADSGIGAFALRSETGWGRLVDAAGLAGMWNAAALPASRETVLARVSTVLLLALAAAGLPAVRRFWRAGHRADVLAAGLAAGVGYLVAVLPVLPGGERLLRTLIEVLPGAGLLRDGHRWLGLTALVLAVLCGLGVSELGVGRAGESRSASRQVAVAVFAALLVVASVPDLAGGLGGKLRSRSYPAAWTQVRDTLDASDDRARVLVLPWQPFRVFSWSGPDPVLDPAPRLLPRQSIVSDALTVSGQRLAEEGLGARAMAADLADGALSEEQLRALAVGWVLIERDTPGAVPQLPAGWTPVLDGPQLQLLRAPGSLPSAPRAGRGRTVAVVASQTGAGFVALAGGTVFALVGVRRRRQTRTGGSPSRTAKASTAG